jgi:hypothetical protein
MVKLEEAIAKAKEFLKCSEIGKVLEAPGYWILYKKTDEVEVGGYGALISKDTGETKPFVLPDEKNFELLDKSKEVVI